MGVTALAETTCVHLDSHIACGDADWMDSNNSTRAMRRGEGRRPSS